MSPAKSTSERRSSHSRQLDIRAARDDDIGYMTGLSGKVFSQYGPYDRLLKNWVDYGIPVSLVATINKRPAGFAMVGPHMGGGWQPGLAELLAIAVDPLKTRMGIGQLLIKEIEDRALWLDFNAIVLHTALENLPAQKLFEKQNYFTIQIKKRFYPKGQDAMMMLKNLAKEIK